MPFLHNPDTGKTIDVPSDPKEAQRLQHKGFSLVEKLVNTSNGYEVLIPIEGQIENGQGIARALSQKRTDAGHEGEAAFVSPDVWRRFSEAERKKMLREPRQIEDSYAKPADLLAKVIERDDEIKKLRAEIEAIKAKGGK